MNTKVELIANLHIYLIVDAYQADQLALSNTCETIQFALLSKLSESKRTIYATCNRQGESLVQNISDILDHHASYILLDPYKRPTQFQNAQAVVN